MSRKTFLPSPVTMFFFLVCEFAHQVFIFFERKKNTDAARDAARDALCPTIKVIQDFQNAD